MRKWFVLAVILSILFVEFYFINELFYCVHWGVQGIFFIISASTTIIALIICLFNFERSAFLISFISGIIIVSFCIYNLNELIHLKKECSSLIRRANNVKTKSGKYPLKLDCEMDKRIIYTKIDDNKFNIFFYVTDKNSGHFYNPKEGWGYMDD